MHRTFHLGLALCCLGLLACSSIPTFDERIRPLEPACTEDGSPACPGGQLCLSGRCFEACVSNDECSVREACQDGVCVSTGRAIDAGMFDAGAPPMPCDGMCAAGEVCDLRTDDCVSCFDERQCTTGDALVCDYSRGECITPVDGTACRPCNVVEDCDGGMSCVLRTAFNEQVCMRPCSMASDCSSGYVCNTLDGVCEPALGGCTQLRRALDEVTCENDVDCVARRKTAEPGACNDVGVCRAACLMAVGCPGGWTCDGTHCQAPPTM